MTNPAVSIIVATHDRPWELVVTLASLKVQTFHDFEVIVVHEPSTYHNVEQARQTTLGFGEQFRFEAYPERMNDWGNTAKHWAAKTHATGSMVGLINGDDYYCPLYLQIMSWPIRDGRADFTYCDFVTHNTRFQDVYRTKPEPAWIDGGGWLCKREIVADTEWNKEGSSPDGTFAEAIAKQSRVEKVPGVLWMHC